MEREVQPLQVRDEPHADVGLDAPRETERGVAAQPGSDGLHRADRQGSRSVRTRPCSSRRLRRSRRRSRPARVGIERARRPTRAGADSQTHQFPVGATVPHEAPALFALLTLVFLARFEGFFPCFHLDRGYQPRCDSAVRFSVRSSPGNAHRSDDRPRRVPDSSGSAVVAGVAHPGGGSQTNAQSTTTRSHVRRESSS